MSRCPACLEPFPGREYRALADHFEGRALASDPDHVRWLNQTVSRKKMASDELARQVGAVMDLRGGTLTEWVKGRFIAKFYGRTPHPFVAALQHPGRPVLLGYVIEHQHFLKQWVRSCSYIAARTDRDDVVLYELDNLMTEFGGRGPGAPAHYELLLRMGESLGWPRAKTLATPPLPVTRRSLDGWNRIATTTHWVEAMAAMHSLELVASRTLVDDGASVHYFDPAILEGDAVSEATKAFLREGYEADVGHSEEALRLVSKYARELDLVAEVQGTVLRSFDLFDDYLTARLERAELLEAQ